MRYVCCECGAIVEEDYIIINPDGDANCEGCYKEHEKDFFDTVEPEPSVVNEPFADKKPFGFWNRE